MPSILQAMAVPDDAQYEEQNHNHNNGHIRSTNNIGHNHRNAHAHFHKHTQKKRQEIAVEDMPPQNLGNIQVTEVFQTTISIIEQINVDTNGNIIGTITYTTSEDTPSTSDTLVIVSSESLTPSATAIVPILPSATSAKSSGDETSYPPRSSRTDTKSEFATPVPSTANVDGPILSTQTSILLQPSPDAPTVPGVDNGSDETVVGVAPLVPTLIPGINATDAISEVAAIITFSNGLSATVSTSLSTTPSDSSSSISSSTTSTTNASDDSEDAASETGAISFKFGATRSTSTFVSSSSTYIMIVSGPSSTVVAGGTDFGSGIVIDNNGGNAGPGTGLEGNPNNDAETSTKAPAGVVAGSVIGGVAGVAIIAFLIMMFLKWKKRKGIRLSISSGNNILPPSNYAGASGSVALPVAERQSIFAIPAFGFYKKSSDASRALGSESTGEKGFVKVAGRKLPSVLQHGGDGYEAPAGSMQHSQSGEAASYYRDDQGFFSSNKIVPAVGTSSGQQGSPQRPNNQRQLSNAFLSPGSADENPFLDPAEDKDPFEEEKGPVYRDGPARQASFTPLSPSRRFTSQHFSPPKRPDYLGRSHPSRDGSRHSKFQEDV